jgi:hypothetical protein
MTWDTTEVTLAKKYIVLIDQIKRIIDSYEKDKVNKSNYRICFMLDCYARINLDSEEEIINFRNLLKEVVEGKIQAKDNEIIRVMFNSEDVKVYYRYKGINWQIRNLL